jgi:riboflavin kinase/FMN adenylyltransferase
MVDVWYTDKVVRGSGGGGKLGFPTINLNPERFVGDLKEGVYSCQIGYKDEIYRGILYFGPRFINNETRPVLEIHILNFNRQIYGQTVEFKIGQYLREPKKFTSLEDLKKQIEDDIRKAF